jgi:hypothetical protein
MRRATKDRAAALSADVAASASSLPVRGDGAAALSPARIERGEQP